jgi:hypothetical protein
MGCTRALDEDRAARYVAGRLAEDERDAFELHYFDCPACLEVVEALTAARDVLAAPAARKAVPRPVARWSWAAGLAAVGVGTALVLRAVGPGPVPTPAEPVPTRPVAPPTTPAPRPNLAALARFEPPGYVPLTFRGGGAEPAGFASAMERYARRDYSGAARALRAVVEARPTSAAPRFYLGISELMAGQVEAGAAALASAARSGDPVYVPAARFYLGRAHLARGDVASARAELEAVAGTEGDLAGEARALLGALEPVGSPRPETVGNEERRHP